ncbi:MAG: hypothetical protein RML38_12100, partial [Bacteroidia bacterium]|nr:hypothetical protein [Bacteroidia bacterium]
RPYLLPILVFFALGLFYKYRKENKLRLLLNLIFFMLAFILAESAWVIRNYIHFKKIVPLIVEEQIFGKGRMSALRDFIASIGGDKTFWNPNAEIMVFYDSRINKLVPARYQNPEDLPKYMFTSYYNADSLRKLREWYYLADTTSSVELQNYADSVVIATIERYKTSFIKEKPFYYYIVAPLRILMKFLVHSGTYNLNSVPFEQLSVYKKILKIAYSALYYFTWLFGIIACSIVLFHLPLQHHFHSVLVALTGIYPIVLFPIIYRSAEYRYFALSYPFLFMVAVWLLSIILTKLKTLHKYLI